MYVLDTKMLLQSYILNPKLEKLEVIKHILRLLT